MKMKGLIKELKKIIEVIEADCSDRGFELQEVASGYRFQVKQEPVPGWASCGMRASALLDSIRNISANCLQTTYHAR